MTLTLCFECHPHGSPRGRCPVLIASLSQELMSLELVVRGSECG